MTPRPGTPSDWVSGERVFAPPRGTVDVDWLVPAVLELVPGSTPARARAALDEAWQRRRAAGGGVDGTAGTAPGPEADRAPGPTDLDGAVDRVLTRALEAFHG